MTLNGSKLKKQTAGSELAYAVLQRSGVSPSLPACTMLPVEEACRSATAGFPLIKAPPLLHAPPPAYPLHRHGVRTGRPAQSHNPSPGLMGAEGQISITLSPYPSILLLPSPLDPVYHYIRDSLFPPAPLFLYLLCPSIPSITLFKSSYPSIPVSPCPSICLSRTSIPSIYPIYVQGISNTRVTFCKLLFNNQAVNVVTCNIFHT